ncbi:hypothetical protein F443_01220 [Phytophthora nicotianae P1569]|uniref:Uncharacterized protein n=1 Tax=Phytophthora nicotianae P1569 TaxID=1317065 RepID=V9G0L6_PHYNI|nr:hypothetical protein F443_01220 [Phytophthora nicotianae P1569]
MAIHPPQQYALEQGGPFRVSKTPTFATSPLTISSAELSIFAFQISLLD